MKASNGKSFERNYALHLQHMKLKGLQPKTVEAYSRAIRRIGARFDGRIDQLTEQQLTDYFTEQLASHSWSTVAWVKAQAPILCACCGGGDGDREDADSGDGLGSHAGSDCHRGGKLIM